MAGSFEHLAIGSVQDAIATDRLVATSTAFDLHAKAAELHGTAATYTVSPAQAHEIYTTAMVGIPHPAMFIGLYREILVRRAGRKSNAANAILALLDNQEPVAF